MFLLLKNLFVNDTFFICNFKYVDYKGECKQFKGKMRFFIFLKKEYVLDNKKRKFFRILFI